jgi:glycine/D-amino acid oxidase-like deaminating enzyme
MTRQANADQVVIAGAGLAGLAAAAAAARAGARVLILDEKSPGGRARTDEMNGFRVNRGPHAVYQGGAGRRVLSRLGVRPATGTPAGTRRLLPADPGWDGLGPEVTAACLDLGVRHARARLTFGIDEPLYLSPHAPGGRLAPVGSGMVHVMRYGATSADADHVRLEAFASAAGITAGDVVAARFLPKMTVATALPAVGIGLAGRPAVTLREMPGLFVAGDWAGPVGWLSDASLASGEQAGLLAARAVRYDRHCRHVTRRGGAAAPLPGDGGHQVAGKLK